MLNWQLARATAILASVSLNSSGCQSAHGREPVDTVSATNATMVKLYNLATLSHKYTHRCAQNSLNTQTQEKYSLRGCTNWPGLRLGFSSTADVFSSAWEDHSLTSRAVVRATTKEWDLDLRSTLVTESALWAQNTNLPLDKALWLQSLDYTQDQS